MVQVTVRFSDDDKHISVFVGDEVVPVITIHKEEEDNGKEIWIVTDKDGKELARTWGKYPDILGYAVGTAAGRGWESDPR